MRTIILRIALMALAAPAVAEPREGFGYGGELGEWELSATVTERASSINREFFRPMTMTPVRICTQYGPEKKAGEIRFQVLDVPPQLHATLLVDGVSCTYSGKRSDFYSGTLICPGRAGVTLKLWLK